MAATFDGHANHAGTDWRGMGKEILPPQPWRWAARVLCTYVAVAAASVAGAYVLASIPNSPLRRVYSSVAQPASREKPFQNERAISPGEFRPIADDGGIPMVQLSPDSKLSWVKPTTSGTASPDGASSMITTGLVQSGNYPLGTTQSGNYTTDWTAHPSDWAAYKGYSQVFQDWTKLGSKMTPYPTPYRLPVEVGTEIYNENGALLGRVLRIASEANGFALISWAVVDVIKPDNTVVRVFNKGPKLSRAVNPQGASVIVLDETH